MSDRHLPFWPAHAPRQLDERPDTLFEIAARSARRFPDKPLLICHGQTLSFRRFHDDACRLAGFLEQDCGVRAGDRVLLLMQNGPQFLIGFYAILRANAVVVPVNPMSVADELRHYIDDAGISTALVADALMARIAPLLGPGQPLRRLIVAGDGDSLDAAAASAPPPPTGDAVTAWSTALGLDRQPGPLTATAADLCVMPYTSGTTGRPKGCMHTHRAVVHSLLAFATWFDLQPDATVLASAPWFHVTGMQCAMNAPLSAGNTIVVLPRWDRSAAAELIQRHRVSAWTAVPTMVIDLLSHPDLAQYDLSSLRQLSGGGAAMPAAIAQQLIEMKLPYVEGYGLTETIAGTHTNPPQRPKKQCLGIPLFGTDSRVVDVQTRRELPAGEIGEIIIHSPQLLVGYWRNPQATADAFVDIDGKRFLRTGDLGHVDEDGYFFLVDRLKRMINAAGYKVWPAEVESAMYQHPKIQEACVIAARDARRGETVKAVVVLKAEWRGRTGAEEIIDWCRTRMAAYKQPRIVVFADALPRSGSGKILWRELQERENAASAGDPPAP